jgi:hypothetical protein
MSLTKAQQAQENGAYVRRLLSKRHPVFAAALAAAERDFSGPVCPCKQREMAAHRLSTARAIGRPSEVNGGTPGRLLLLVRQMAGTPIPQGNLPRMLRIQICGPAGNYAAAWVWTDMTAW